MPQTASTLDGADVEHARHQDLLVAIICQLTTMDSSFTNRRARQSRRRADVVIESFAMVRYLRSFFLTSDLFLELT